jgi:hypothetical protein
VRYVVWFSCGAASAVAAKMACDKYGSKVVIVNCDTTISEHPDNIRFRRDVEGWLGRSIVRITSDKYTDIDDVFEKTRYMAGIAGARCTAEMKKRPRFAYQHPYDVHLFGYTAEEQKRIERFEGNNFDLKLEWILRDNNITKDDCFQILKEAGIELPAMYGLGFKNNNCLGCVKATSPKYWNLVRKNFPDVFAKRAEQSRKIGVRLTRYKGERMFLDELPIEAGKFEAMPDLSCGPQCEPEGAKQ